MKLTPDRQSMFELANEFCRGMNCSKCRYHSTEMEHGDCLDYITDALCSFLDLEREDIKEVLIHD